MTDLKKPPESPVSDGGNKTLIGKTFVFDGVARTDDDAVIEGRFNGKIEVGKTLTVEKTGQVKAEIKALNIRILGRVEGNILDARKVSILPYGEFSGDIQTQKIEIAEGAVFNGSISMTGGK